MPREMLSFKTTLAPVPTVQVNVVYVKKSLILYITVEGNSGFLNYLCRLIIILFYSVPSCPECKSPHSCTTKPGSRDVTVVTANGK
jgi:hypothetical protein